ncbi:DUF4288 domain-containing protein [Adhaeribacter arboris]|uniref:DUF4288 domain-containing protein n=1 Tax=Adhaeribacter arboris TaxID=2072846 RepID=A0A2T2Y9W5_9BACT|nr:DUF4288 domain-containing protein [Adhaeribacter arboris]PSR52302.1 DUF4288 domain-containing protein [Adhaeribacter arboris]
MKPVEKIINKGNWFIAEIIERTEPADTDKTKPNRRCTVWGNYHLVKADSLEEAYDKAEKLGADYNYTFKNDQGVEMEISFVGIGDFLPLYEDLEDGAEILWTDYGQISAKSADKFIKPKEEWIEAASKVKKKE